MEMKAKPEFSLDAMERAVREQSAWDGKRGVSCPPPAIKRNVSDDTEIREKAKKTSDSFKRPSMWVCVFGWFLAVCAGFVNAVCYRTFGYFVSHVTGTTTSIALGIEGYHHDKHDAQKLLAAVALLISFLLGAFTCGLLIDKTHVHFGGKAFYGVALIGNALLLVVAVMLYDPAISGTNLLAACCAAVASGLQNAMCTSHLGAVVRTTHVTGTLTDIGSTMGRICMIYLRKGCRSTRLNVLEKAEVVVDARKLMILGPMWICFLLGTVKGVYVQHHVGVFALLLPALGTFSVGVMYSLFRQRLKQTLKSMEKARLQKDMGRLLGVLERTSSYIQSRTRAKSRMQKGDDDDDGFTRQISTDTNVIVCNMEQELSEMLETMHQVEADLGDLCEATQRFGLQEEGDEEAPQALPGRKLMRSNTQ